MLTSRLARSRLHVALVAATIPAGAANAQHRLDASASVALTETYDDNVFALPTDTRQDMVSRLTPRLGVAYLARPYGDSWRALFPELEGHVS
jgi:hypothetical protein